MRSVVSTTIAVCMIVLRGAGCSGDGVTGAAKPRTIMMARFDTPDVTDCSVAGSSLMRGAFGDKPAPLTDGTGDASGVNHVACRVADLGNDRFSVDGTIRSDDRVLFAIRGTFPKTSDAKGFLVDSVTVSNGATGPGFAAFTQANGQCRVLYAASTEGVVRGRVWAEVTCPAATRDPVAGGAGSGTCVTIAQFRFEDCATD
jgi:hypothetical protein